MSAEILRRAAGMMRARQGDISNAMASLDEVADWLDGMAGRWERDGLTPERTHAVMVARTYLGGES